MDLIIRNSKVVTVEKTFITDIGISRGKIKVLAPGLESNAKENIDATGMLTFPGIIDSHVHFQLPIKGMVSSDDFENGTKAAACGGVTTVIDFATQKKGETLLSAVSKRVSEADSKVAIDYSLHASPTEWNKHTLNDMRLLMDNGITSFKLYMTYAREGLMSDDAALYSALELTAKSGGLITVHAESARLLDLFIERYHNLPDMKKYKAYCHALSRPNIVEFEAIQRAALFSESTGGSLYIVHLSTKEGAGLVESARQRGVKIYAETCPQYLLLNDTVFKRPDGYLYATCPQVKKKVDSEALWNGLKNGSISTIATDTCTFTRKQKRTWKGDFTKIPYGLPGVETMLPLIYTFGVGKKRITLNQMVALLSTNPAKIMGLYPQKGTIMVGSDADLVIFDPHKKTILTNRSFQTNCDWSPYEGFKLIGYPFMTLSRGQVVAINGKFVGRGGHGRFVRRGRRIGL
jgi:dihydropyrimidinase